jgi:hypothetical protein
MVLAEHVGDFYGSYDLFSVLSVVLVSLACS